MTQLYWQVYLNLEKEFIDLTDAIHVNDRQQSVYSMKIADLIIRTVIEIEALSKELYLTNGGPVVPDEDMYFDTVCMAYLDRLWNLDMKVVLVVSPTIFFEKEENTILRPLHKAHKRGTSSTDWNKAYQALKHNRVKELSKGCIKNLLHGLAALYVLNLYYADKSIMNISSKDKTSINYSFGSSLFAVKVHIGDGIKADGIYQKRADYDECVYIEDYESKSKQKALEAVAAMDDYVERNTSSELERLVQEKELRGETVTEEWLIEERNKLLNRIFPIKDYKLGKIIQDGLSGLHYDIVLNKNQH